MNQKQLQVFAQLKDKFQGTLAMLLDGLKTFVSPQQIN